MRIIDRLIKYLQHKKITAYSFERNCRVANGYLKKQEKGKGTIGSVIIERIHQQYVDLNLTWLIAGQGDMLMEEGMMSLVQEEGFYLPNEQKIQFLNERIRLLEGALADKEKIIALLEGERKN